MRYGHFSSKKAKTTPLRTLQVHVRALALSSKYGAVFTVLS
jgi:hypothetical protein